MTKLKLLLRSASAVALTLVACTQEATEADRPAYLVPLDSVPTEVRRRGIQVLEEHRASPSSEAPDGWPGWGDAGLWDHALALQRPDVAGVAYHEFPLVAGDEHAALDPEDRLRLGADAFRRGTITLSTGTHDAAIDMGSFCFGDLRATPPWDMVDAAKELSGKTLATIRTNANYFGYGEDRLRDLATDQITKLARPAIIGTGFLQHYPLAYGFAFRYRLYTLNGQVQNIHFARHFHVDNGWQGSLGDGWVGSSTWFAGRLRP